MPEGGGGIPTGTHHILLPHWPSLAIGVGAAWDKVCSFRLNSKGRWSWHCVFSFFQVIAYIMGLAA